MVFRRSKKSSVKNTIKKYKGLLKLGLFLYLLVFFIIPVGVGSFSQRAKYFPQYLEAQKLRGYYRCIAFIPGTTSDEYSIEQSVIKVANEYSMHPALIQAIVTVESSGNQFALSPVGGCGLMQLMPHTYFSLQGGNPFGVRSNLRAGTHYLRQLYRRYNGDLDKTLAAYNAGPQAVSRHGGIPPYGETIRFVKRVKKLYALNKIS